MLNIQRIRGQNLEFWQRSGNYSKVHSRSEKESNIKCGTEKYNNTNQEYRL